MCQGTDKAMKLCYIRSLLSVSCELERGKREFTYKLSHLEKENTWQERVT